MICIANASFQIVFRGTPAVIRFIFMLMHT